jgi:hypothetical protein
MSDEGDTSLTVLFTLSLSLLCNKQFSTHFKIKVYLNATNTDLSAFSNFIIMYMGKKLIQNFVILLHDIRKIAIKGKKLDSFRCTFLVVCKVN